MDNRKVKTSLYVPADLMERARALAEQEGRTVSNVLARALAAGIGSAGVFCREVHPGIDCEEYERGVEARRALMLRPAY